VLLHLVRHGRPLVDRTIAPWEWRLDPDGYGEIEALRAALPTSASEASWFSSDERKALATASRLTESSVEPIPELREARRTAYVEDRAAFADAVLRGLQHPDSAAIPGWEPLERTRRRVVGTVTELVKQAPGHVVLVGHGTAWTLLISDLLDAPIPQRLPPMTMPDLLILDLSTRRVVQRWGDWRSH
jgi:broad specificity phosphatase PhoE